MADVDVGINWNLSGAFEGLGSGLASAKDKAWTGIKNSSEEAAASIFGIGMILIASIWIWRVVK